MTVYMANILSVNVFTVTIFVVDYVEGKYVYVCTATIFCSMFKATRRFVHEYVQIKYVCP